MQEENKNVILSPEAFAQICLICIILGQGHEKDDPTMLLRSFIGLMIHKQDDYSKETKEQE